MRPRDIVKLMTLAFSRYELRTIEVDAAHEFYSGLLGHDQAIIWPLHEQARARGAVPHWLGSIEVDDLQRLERSAETLVGRGATMLGPTRPAGDGRYAAVLRDPGGAILGLTTGPVQQVAPTVDVSWHVLNTNDVSDAISNYKTLFGWSISEKPSIGPYGTFHEFRWETGNGRSAGVMADIAGRPGIHPHWLFFFNVASVDAAVALTRAAGGSASGPVVNPAGERIAICEDPQGAAFGVIEARHAP
jgi:predicted enzyme related to lactoylglutathione lyase